MGYRLFLNGVFSKTAKKEIDPAEEELLQYWEEEIVPDHITQNKGLSDSGLEELHMESILKLEAQFYKHPSMIFIFGNPRCKRLNKTVRETSLDIRLMPWRQCFALPFCSLPG